MSQEALTGVDFEGALKLALTFQYRAPVVSVQMTDSSSRILPSQDRPSLDEIERLLLRINAVLGTAEKAANWGYPDPAGHGEMLKLLFDPGPQKVTSVAPVIRVHYGSPFDIEMLLPTLSIPGVGMLLYAAKRLFGIDLEFRTYREKRWVEFLEAQQLCEELEEESWLYREGQPKRSE